MAWDFDGRANGPRGLWARDYVGGCNVMTLRHQRCRQQRQAAQTATTRFLKITRGYTRKIPLPATLDGTLALAG